MWIVIREELGVYLDFDKRFAHSILVGRWLAFRRIIGFIALLRRFVWLAPLPLSPALGPQGHPREAHPAQEGEEVPR